MYEPSSSGTGPGVPNGLLPELALMSISTLAAVTLTKLPLKPIVIWNDFRPWPTGIPLGPTTTSMVAELPVASSRQLSIVPMEVAVLPVVTASMARLSMFVAAWPLLAKNNTSQRSSAAGTSKTAPNNRRPARVDPKPPKPPKPITP